MNSKLLCRLLLFSLVVYACKENTSVSTGWIKHTPLGERILYTGRVDVTDKNNPVFWSAGVYFDINFVGDSIGIVLEDEHKWNKDFNQVAILLNDSVGYYKLKQPLDTVILYTNKKRQSNLRVTKISEGALGYLRLKEVLADTLLPAPKSKERKIEFYGNSITSGMGSDTTFGACGSGEWYTQTNASISYGVQTATILNADYQLTSVSGIGLMHSCCEMKITMPDVYDKIDLVENKLIWDFKRYQPQLVCIALGQNDGIQPFNTFVDKYSVFLKQIRTVYPDAQILLLSSPMADEKLRDFLRKTIREVVENSRAAGDNKIASFIFEKSYTGGCDFHPSVAEHTEIARLLSEYIKTIMAW